MDDEIYRRLAGVLDTLPNGFPSTDSGIEIRILKKIFRPEDAELYCDLRLEFETAEQIAERTGRPLEGLEPHLVEMDNRGQVFGLHIEGVRLFKMVPWVFGIYEFQVSRMDRELAAMCEEYGKIFGRQFFDAQPQLMHVIPVEKKIPSRQQALTYERVSSIIESSQAFSVFDCICKKEKRLLDKGCDRPLEICMAFAPIPGVFDNIAHHRTITREEAYSLLDKAEEAALVHLTWNMENGHYFICNCCGCCCGVLRSINELGIPAASAVNAYYFAEIDPDLCVACGTCKDERCQINAIEEADGVYTVIREQCIGCGLCLTTCPSEAISLVRKPDEEIVPPPKDEKEWFKKRARARGIDLDRYLSP